MNIDWDKAPEGATHYYKDSPQPWRDLSGYNWKYFSAGEWHSGPSVCTSAELMRGLGTVLFARPLPQTWTGEGLPPVGIDVEVLHFVREDWTVQHINYIGGPKGIVVFRGKVDQEFACPVISCQFRPIRTPEQVVEEVDIKELEALQRELEHWALITFNLGPKELAEKLMKSGYRKRVAP